jgi:hypothetical protein
MTEQDPEVFEYRSQLVTFAVNLNKKLQRVRKGSENEKSLLGEIAAEAKEDLQKIKDAEPMGMLPHLTEIHKTWVSYMDKSETALSRANPRLLEARTYLGGPEREEWLARR